ncbi:2Fe-2S iron-sulfur cluster-binding protein [Endothiovibrio diazotrophicus]
MANITFSHPEYKDKTVYAVAGSHTDTILKIAKENKIPIAFNCQDGECGTCLVKVTHLSDGKEKGGPLTDKEITVLKGLGKITQEQVDEMAVTDMDHPWRLACQMIVRDEDLRVEYGVE